jgi:hypothetical protein
VTASIGLVGTGSGLLGPIDGRGWPGAASVGLVGTGSGLLGPIDGRGWPA